MKLIQILKGLSKARYLAQSCAVLSAFVVSACGGLNPTQIGQDYYPTVVLSYLNSNLSVSQSAISAGAQTTVKLSLLDTNFNAYISDLPVVTFQNVGGTSQGLFGSVVNNHDGTYTSTFTGTASGTATTIHAFINGVALQNTFPTVTVTSASYSLANSLVSVSSGSIIAGNSAVVTLTLYDNSNTRSTSGGLTVGFSNAGGTSTGIFSPTVDHGDGTYTATFTGLLAGSPTGILASIQGGLVTSTIPTIAVTDIPITALAYSSSTAVYIKNSVITPNTPSHAGGAIDTYSISPSLPAGLSLNTTTGVISGTPTVVSANTIYTVTASNSSDTLTTTIGITVDDIAPSSLTYSTHPAVYIKGLLIANNTPSNSGGTLVAYSVTPPLPTGLSLNGSTGVISGTPTVVSGATNYTITGTNSGGSANTTFSIAVNDVPPSSLMYSANPAVYSLGSAITNNTPTHSGGAVISYSVSPSLPAGLSLNGSTGVISGTPSVVVGASSYTITATNSGGIATTSVSITVNDVVPSTLGYATNPAVYVKGTAITANSPSNSGGAILSYAISPTLPAGLSFNTSNGTISGTPTILSSTTSYTVNGTNSGGSVSTTLSITVNDIPPSTITYSANPATYTLGTLITNNVPTNSGGSITNYAISPALPAGLSFNTTTGIISGTPSTLSGNTAYTVTATGTGGSVTATLNLAVNAVAPSALSYSTSAGVYTKGIAITANSPSASGGAITHFSISPAVPGGLSIDIVTGVISGTPTGIFSNTSFTVTASNSGGSTTAMITMVVNDVAPSALNYTLNPAVYTNGLSLTANSPSSSGGTVISYSVSPALPAGLSFSTSTGVISGTPTAITSVASYTVTATNTGGSTTASVSITVNDVPPSTITYATNPATYQNGSLITPNFPTITGGAVVTFGISPSLPAGLSFNTSTGVISGTPTVVSGSTVYTVTGTNTGGSTTGTLTLTVDAVAPTSLTYSSNPAVYTRTVAISANNPSFSGGAITSYSVSPSLPAGLSLNTSTGVISGTPTAISSAGTYVITATNSGGAITASVVITVNDLAPSSLSYSSNPVTYTVGTTITSNVPSNSGGTALSYSISPTLPAGLSFNTSSGLITGTPTAITSVASYTVTATNTGGSTTASVSITVNNSAPASLTYSSNPAVYTKGSAITTNAPSSSGGAPTSYSVSPPLPAGLSLDTTTGNITGTPTAITSTASYTVTATNTGGSTTASVSITVNDVIPSSLTYSTNPAVYTRGSAISSNTPSSSGGAVVSYSVSPALPAGLSLNTGTGVISGTPTAITSVASYTVTATNTGGSTTASVSITVNDVAPSALTYSTNPAVYTNGTTIASNNPTNSGGSVLSYTISPALPSGLGISVMTGVISGTPSVVSGTTSYTVTATNSGGSTTASVSITVDAVIPSALTYSSNPAVYTKGSAITANTPTSSGGTITSYSVSPALPAGLSLNTGTGIISGTPTAITGTASYTVTALNSGGSITASVSITVNDVIPSSLTYSTNPAVYTKGSAITSNSPTSSGGAVVTYSVSPALPTGLSLNTGTGVISGTPTSITSVASYTVTATNTGGSTTAAVSITVNDVIPSSLTYSTNPAIYTRGSAITSNSPTSSGGTVVSYSVSPSLPAGLSLNTGTGLITGTPTAITSAASYTVTATNTGGSTTASVSITIQDVIPSSLTYSTNPAVYIKGSAITTNSPTSSGGTVVSYSVSPALPTGLTLNTGTGLITGTPTAITSVASYTVTATNTGGSTTASLSITVNDVIPSSLTYSTNPAVYTKGSAITSNTPSNSGGAVASYSVSPALPTGLTLNTGTGVISGTPTAITSVASYTVTATNTGGSTTASVSITVNDVIPSSLTYSTNPAVYTLGSAITSNSPTSSGGTVASYSVSPSLPAGLSFNTGTGVITGTPTAITALASYTVTATNTGGSTTASVSITVNDVIPSSLTYSTNPAVYTKGSAITSNSPTISGGSVVSYSVSPTLPAGLSLNTGTGVITGTPTAITSVASYTVTATNTGGSTTASVSITVNDVIPSSLTYSANPAVYTKGSAITSNTPSNSGGAVASYSVSPALPTGLTLNTGTGLITGTPTAITSTASYTVTATNTGGSTTASVSITINDVIPSSLTYSTNPAVYTKGTAITSNSPTSSGGPVVSYSVSPALPTGLSLNTGTGVITGTPTAITAVASYTVTATNTGGSTTASVSITVNDVIPSSLTYSTNPAVYTKGSAITSNSPTSSGGTVATYSVSPALPAGLTLNTGTGVITGTPTAITSVASYTVTATNTGGSTTASVSITVNDVIPSSLTYSTNPAVYTKGSAITSNSPSSSGGTVTSYSVTPTLPAGLSFNTGSGVITGTPTAITGVASYTVTATNTGGSTTASVSITVNDVIPSSLSYSLNPAVYIKGSAITSNTPTVSGGPVVSYSVSPALPAGLSLNTGTGVITGTPTTVTATTSYTVSATNTGGSATASVSITVNDVIPSSLTYSTNPAIYTKGTAITTNSPSNSGGSILSYTVSPALPAGLSISLMTGVITGTPTAITSSASYTVTGTNSGGSTTVSVTITVNDVIPSSLSYSSNPAVYTINSAITSNTPTVSGGTVVTYSVSPSLPTGLTLNTGTGVITGTPTAITALASYTVTATNTGGSTTASVSITVNDVIPSSLSYTTSSPTYTVGFAISSNSPTSSGGAVVSYSVSPALPAGLSLNTGTGVITGTPTATASSATYTVTATNTGGSATKALTIIVGAPTIAVSSGNSQSGTVNATLGSAFVALVQDATGTAASSITVDWAVTGGGGSLSSASNATNGSGLSSSTLTLGSSAGTNTVTATIHSTSYVTTFTATAITPFVNIFRSVGVGSTTALATGSGANKLTISGNTATFTAALATKIGVGDVIQYDSLSNGTIDTVAFISGRTSSTVYTIQTVSGGSSPTTITNDVSWSIFRAYTSLANSFAGSENTGIASAVRNFDTWVNGTNLVTLNAAWNIAVYADNLETGDLTLSSTWTTSATNYIRVYTPYLSTEVGTTQRHSGVWDSTKYYLQSQNSGFPYIALAVQTPYARIEGLQILDRNTSANVIGGALSFAGLSTGASYISKNIISGPSTQGELGINVGGGTNTDYVWDNIVYGFSGTNSVGIQDAQYYPGTVTTYNYWYNNTVYNCYTSMYVRTTTGGNSNGRSAFTYLINNISQGSGALSFSNNGSAGVFNAGSDYNVSNDTSAPGTHSKKSATVNFLNSGSNDFRLDLSDTNALGNGTNLSANTYLPFSDDIMNFTRGTTWDIGAHQLTGSYPIHVGTSVCTDNYLAGTTLTLSYTPYKAGDTLVVAASNDGTSPTVTSITDNGSSGGSSYISRIAPGSAYPAMFGTLSVASGVTSITVTMSAAGGSLNICVSEYTGSITSFGNTSTSSSSTAAYTGSVTTQDPNNYIVMSCDDGTNTAITPTATVGTLRASAPHIWGSVWIQDNTVEIPGSVTNSGTLSSTGGPRCTSIELRSH